MFYSLENSIYLQTQVQTASKCPSWWRWWLAGTHCGASGAKCSADSVGLQWSAQNNYKLNMQS